MIRLFLALFCSTLLALPFLPGTVIGKELITLSLPEAVIAEATSAILPLDIDAHSESIEGGITIIDISELQLTKDHLTCRLHLAGKDLAFLTEIAGHEIRLNVGTVELDFKTNALIRFDANKQILYIKPVVDDLTGGSSSSGADIGQALIAVLNGREFPLTIEELEPLIARAGSKNITINTSIENIEAKPKAIELSLAASIVSKKK